MALSSLFPEPLIIPPFTLPHKQTIILLHGRGSRASIFGPALLNTTLSPTTNTPDTGTKTHETPTTNLRTSFPHAKFIFPTSPRRRATIYKRSIINQWFDSWHIDLLLDNDSEDSDDSDNDLISTSPSQQPKASIRRRRSRISNHAHAQDWLMIDGLQQTTAYLHNLLHREISLIPGGAKSIVLGGISQGCAASLVAMMLWEGEALGGILGMCGWLPFAGGIMNVLGADKDADEHTFDPFERESDEVTYGADPGIAAVRELRQILELDAESPEDQHRPFALSTPVFLGHGADDDCVPLRLGTLSVDCLRLAGINVSWHSYPGLGHWYSMDMVRDMVNFLKAKPGFSEDMS